MIMVGKTWRLLPFGLWWQELLVAGHTAVSDRKQRGWLKSELGYNLQRPAPDDPPLPAIFPIPQL